MTGLAAQSANGQGRQKKPPFGGFFGHALIFFSFA